MPEAGGIITASLHLVFVDWNSFSHSSGEGVVAAMYVLAQLAHWIDGAAAVIEAGALQPLDELTQSVIPGVRQWACMMVADLVQHPSTRSAVLAANPCGSLMVLLR
jgi:hypothetical protein